MTNRAHIYSLESDVKLKSSWLLFMTVLTLSVAGCSTTPTEVQPKEAEKRILEVPELDSKAALPLSVAVYITPRVLGRAAIMDLRQGKTAVKNVIHNGQLGAASIAAVTKYFPFAFSDVHLITNFPDSRLLKYKVDLVVTIDDVTAVRQILSADSMSEVWDTRVYLGLYHPDGTTITHYAVTASSQHPASEKITNLDERIQWIYQASQNSINPAMRLALLRFPKLEVLDALQVNSIKQRHKLTTEEWLVRHQDFFEHLSKEKLNIPLPTMTLEQTFNRQTQQAADNMVMANALVLLNAKIFAQFYSRNPGAFNQDIKSHRDITQSIKGVYLHQLQNFSDGRDLNKRPFVFKSIGGQHKIKTAHTKTSETAPKATPLTPAQNNTPTPTVNPVSTPVELIKVYALLRSLNTAGKPKDAGSAGDCSSDLRKTKDALLSSAKDAGMNSQLLHSAGSGATVYSKNLCATAVPSNLDPSQASYETQRVTLCGIQTINCALSKTFTGMDCQQALKLCRSESPTPKY